MSLGERQRIRGCVKVGLGYGARALGYDRLRS